VRFIDLSLLVWRWNNFYRKLGMIQGKPLRPFEATLRSPEVSPLQRL
jgi:hypothetical protein